MARPSKLFRAAKKNAAPSSHHITGRIGPGCFTAPTNRSMIHLETASTVTGTSALATRNVRPAATTLGAASQIKCSTGGILWRAAVRWLQRDRSDALCKETFLAGRANKLAAIENRL